MRLKTNGSFIKNDLFIILYLNVGLLWHIHGHFWLFIISTQNPLPKNVLHQAPLESQNAPLFSSAHSIKFYHVFTFPSQQLNRTQSCLSSPSLEPSFMMEYKLNGLMDTLSCLKYFTGIPNLPKKFPTQVCVTEQHLSKQQNN